MGRLGRVSSVIIAIILLCLFIFQTDDVYAASNSIEKSHIHVFVHADGSAVITEVRTINIHEGTENFIVIENLGMSLIRDFTVTEDGTPYQFVRNWDMNDSRENKSFKNGLIKTGNGYELVWGVGEYGRHEYTIQYTVTDFVKGLSDAQIIYWRFVNDYTDIPPKEVKIEIEAEQIFSEENEGIWAFGHDGNIHFSNGKVLLETTKPMKNNQYVTILMRLNPNAFQTNDVINQTFDEIQDEALKGSDYTNNSKTGGMFTGFAAIIGILLMLLIPFIFFIAFLGVIIYIISKNKYLPAQRFTRKYPEEYYRDYPYEGNFLHAYYILSTMGLTTLETVLTALFLKWIHEDRLVMQSELTGMFKKETAALVIQSDGQDLLGLEREMFRYMVRAAGEDGILQQKEFNKWGRKNNSLIAKWEENLRRVSIEKLLSAEYIQLGHKKFLFFNMKLYEFTEEGKKIEINTYKFVNYLHDFSLLNEHEAINVKLWDELMIWAGLLGQTKVVTEQFKKLYPNYLEESMFDSHTLTYTVAMTSSFHSSVQQSRSAGSGGSSSSSGGGGGSFGGGSGGGVR